MANEIYDSTWWGNTIQTASSIGTSTEMIQGQFNLTKIGDEEVTNGDFATDSNWNVGTSWSITNGKAICNGGGNYLQQQPIVFEVGKTYKCEFDIIDYTSGTVRFRLSTSNNGSELSGKGSYTEYITIASKTDNYLNIIGSSFIGSIDNVSVKEVRATTVEASKCLADAIHRIGIQDIQN
jgi:hypothetical protein